MFRTGNGGMTMFRIALFLICMTASVGIANADECFSSYSLALGPGTVCHYPPPGSTNCLQARDQSNWFCPQAIIIGPPPPPPPPPISGVPPAGSFPPGAIQDAAWCITKNNDKMIKDKSMSTGNCLGVIAQFPWVSVITEHQLGKAAIYLACGSNAAGIPAGAVTAIGALAVCQCHSLPAQARLASQSQQVLAKLREWGHCGG